MSSSPQLSAVTLADTISPSTLLAAVSALSLCDAIATGDFEAAVSQITRTAAQALAVDRLGVWLFRAQGTLVEADTYLLNQNRHRSGQSLAIADYADHLTRPLQVRALETIDPQDSSFAKQWLRPHNVAALLEVPICRRGQAVGLLWCEQVSHSRQWTAEEQSFAVAVAGLAALALEAQQHQQAQAAQQQHSRQSALLKETLNILKTAPSDRAVIQQAAEHIGQAFGVERCTIWSYVPDAPSAVAIGHFLSSAASSPADPAPLEDLTLIAQILAAPAGTLAKALQPRLHPELQQPWLAIPTGYRGVANGFITLHDAHYGRLPQRADWSVLQDSAASLGVVLAHTQLQEQEKQQQGTLDRQHQQLRREIIERQQAEQAWHESQRFIQSILDASTNILYVNNFETGENFYINRCLQSVLGYEPSELQTMGTHFLEQLVHDDDRQQLQAQHRKLEYVSDGAVVESEYRLRHRQGSWRWMLCRETIFQRDSDGRPFQVFGTATDITERKQAEVALQEANKELKRLASIDGLTQLANRRSFDEYLSQSWAGLTHRAMPLTLILCDIDYFKCYNDEYGHQTGDTCLQQVAQAISQAAKRSSDLVARYGGEEFAIILPSTSVEGAQCVAEEIRRQISQLQIPHCRSEVASQLTVSMGIASVTAAANLSSGELVAAADRGLYRAKSEGRDRVCVELL